MLMQMRSGAQWLLAVVLCAGVILSSVPAQAANAVVEQARKLLAEKQAPAAFDMLSPLEPQRAGDPEFDYLLGIAALDSGHATRAIFALERVLSVQPENALARAEIARAYFVVGEIGTAKTEFSTVRGGNIPEQAAATVDRYLDAINRLQASNAFQIRGYLQATVGYDSNVNSATANSQIAVPAFGGLVVTLDATGVKQHDTFASVGGGLNLRAPISPDLAFVAGASAAKLVNNQQDRFDTGTLDGNAGLAYTLGRDVFTVALQGNQFYLDNSRFREAYGILGQWQRTLHARAQVSAFVQAANLHYPSQSIRDAHRYVAGVGYAYSFGADRPVVYVSAYGGRENEKADGVPQLGHQLGGLRAGGQLALSDRLSVFADASYEDRRYGGPEPFFDVTRGDQQYSFAAGVHYLPAKDWRITPQVSLVRNHSNVEIFDFTRAIASVTLRREF